MCIIDVSFPFFSNVIMALSQHPYPKHLLLRDNQKKKKKKKDNKNCVDRKPYEILVYL